MVLHVSPRNIYKPFYVLLAVIENSKNDAFLPFLPFLIPSSAPFPSRLLSIFICSFQLQSNFSATATLGARGK